MKLVRQSQKTEIQVGRLSRIDLENQKYTRVRSTNFGENKGMSVTIQDEVLDRNNLNKAYLRVKSNRGAAGIDEMTVDELFHSLRENKEELTTSLREGSYKPLPVKRVEIPKLNGGTRKLGIPTVIDRMVQQAVAQVLTPIFEEIFSENSFGFRPNRGAQDAIDNVISYYNQGYKRVVDLDLKSYFDNVNHDLMIKYLQQYIDDEWTLKLIRKFLTSGILDNGLFVKSEKGTPQGGPLSPLLSNIMLNELDKELERRGLPFVRYADDSMIFCKSKRAAMRVKESITRFIENALYLKVNKEKTVVSYVRGVKYLGYSFYVMKGKCQLTVHPKSKAKMKSRLKELTSRSNGWGHAKRKQKLKEYIKGWVGYYHLANMKRLLLETDEWLRRRIRMCIWKAWKKVKTKVANLIRCGINKYKAYEWGNTRKGYWRIADSYILHRAITNEYLCRAGYATLMGAYLEWHPK